MLSRRDLIVLAVTFVVGSALIVLSYFPFWPVIPFGPKCGVTCPFSGEITDIIGSGIRYVGIWLAIVAMVIASFSIPCFPSGDAKR